MMSFTEIGNELGVSKQRAKQIFDSAINKLSSTLQEQDMLDLQEAIDELGQQEPAYTHMAEALHQQEQAGEGLEGFWKEANASPTT